MSFFCRSWGLAAAAALFAAVLSVAGAARATTAVVLNSDDDSLSVIDSDGYKELSRTHIGRGPHHLIETPDGRTLIIAMSGSNELVLIDRETGVEKKRVTASDPYQIGFSPDGKFLVAASIRLDRIDIYDGQTYQLVHRLPALTMPSHIAFSPDSKTVFVTLQGTSGLTAIDLASGKVNWTVPVGRQPAGIVTRPGGTLLVGVMGSDHIAEVDPANGNIIRKITTGNGAHNFLATPDGKTLYVTNRVAGTISVLDAATLEVKNTLQAPGGPDDMGLSPDGQELWVTGRWHAWVDVIELASGALKTSVPVGRSPHGIFVY
ncbi:MAG TPA: beta-propeller fold lactonase family protein [Stellaceae bacterium]|nr:beta-propeller fold lactonase family protein [Stellaceae bacterium]